MKSSPFAFLFRRLLPSVAAGAVALSSIQAAPPVVLLRDSFNGTGTPDTLNLNYNLSGRQTGALGLVPYTPSGNVQVGNGGEPHDGGHVLLCAFGGTAALNYNFNNSRSAGGLRISFLIDPNSHNNGDISNWQAVNLGASEADRNTGVNGGAAHCGILFRANGKLQAFDGSTGVTPVEPNWLPDGNYSLTFHQIDLVLTGPGDGNPFDGAGDTQIDVFVDGGASPVYSFTKVGGYANNYINFQGSFISDVENLTITAIDPPTPPSDPWSMVGWSGDLDSGVDSSYTYTHAYNFGSGASPVINGVTFTGVDGGNPGVGGRFSVTGIGNDFDDDGGANVTGSSITLARSFIYGGNPGTLTIQGLTPGVQYLLTLYSKAWDSWGNRIQKFSAGANQRVIDQDSYGRYDPNPAIIEKNGIRITYAYTADASGTLTVSMTPLGAGSFHCYGFSNREGTPSPSAWSYSEWTSDATSGITPATHAYTHAYNFGSASTVTINGLPFTGNAAQNPSAAGYTTANFFGFYGGGYTPQISGAGIDLARQFIYDGRPGTLTLNGLVPGRRYVLSLYSASFGPPGRIINFLANGDLQTIDQDAHIGERGIVVSYPYTAGAGGSLTVQMLTVNPGWSFHLCGYSNREEAPATAPVFNVQPADAIVAQGSTATFTAAAAGTAPLSYQWYFGPDVLTGETSPTLNVFADFPDVAGPYSVVVSSPSGSVTSRVATLTVRLPVAGLFNTGVDNSRNPLPDGANDPHYQIIINADGAPISGIVENSAAFPIVAGPWIANTAGSKWIGPRADNSGAGLDTGGGIYVYRTTFDLTGLDLATIVITGGWAIDNTGISIRVNGGDTGIANGNGFAGLTGFTLNPANSTFIDGINTLDFVVRNDDAGVGFTGLHVGNLVGTASLPNTPPSITSQPQGATRGTGESHTFSVAATGSSPLGYQWTLAGTNLPGANGASLTLNNLTHADAGTYAVVLSNPYGTNTSSNAVLVVRDSVPGLYNTGVDDSRVVLADGAVDAHYRLIQNADGASPDAIVENSTIFPIAPPGPWVPNDAASKWIGPRLDTATAAPGDYTYRTTVDLTGFDPSSIEVVGEWATDNGGIDILVNGVASGNINSAQFVTYTTFRLTNGFTAGVNTIDFRMENTGPAVGWTGLRVRGLRGLGDLLPPNTPPFIITQPADTVANQNETATFRVLANGSAPLAYQWYFGLDPLPGETSPVLNVLVDFPDVAGDYSVSISNGAGSTNSRMALLTFNNPPTIPAKGVATPLNTSFTIATVKFLIGVTDPDGDSFVLDSVATTSAQGGSIAPTNGGFTYTPPTGFTGNDSFTFVVRDIHNGVSTGTIAVLVASGGLPSQNQVLLLPRAGGGFVIRFAGILGRAYDIQRATMLVPADWATIATRTAPPHGIIEFEDTTALPTAFYRTVAAP